MAINFPDSPTPDEEFTAGGKTWIYLNDVWVLTGLIASGPAGGDLAGEYPDPTLSTTIQNQINSKAPLTPAVDAKSSNYTLVVGDRGKVITANGTFSLTVPANIFSAGDRVDIVNIGTGDITLAAGAGMTLNSKDGNLKIDGQYAAATILFQTATAGFRIGALKA